MTDFSEPPPERKPPRGTEETDFPIPAQLPPLESAIGRRERLVTIIAAAVVAAFVTVIVVFGLQAFRGSLSLQNTLTQENQQFVPPGQTMEIYYPRPYATPPHLQITSDEPVEISEQKADHFKVKNTRPFTAKVTWKANGKLAD